MEQFSAAGNGLVVRAPAKINLSLLVAGRRADGFHEIETLMAKVDLYDELLFERGEKDGIELICRGPHWAPQGADNLVYRACEALFEAAGAKMPVRVTLTKNVPAASGLGGASSDAAAAMLGLDRFAGMGASAADIGEIACRLGSDIAFFLGGPLAFCTGRGEKIREIEEKFSFRAILALPDVSVSTKRVYGNYEHDQVLYDRLSGRINGLIAKNKFDSVAAMCANMLEKSCLELHRELSELKSHLEALGVGSVCLSGSGSAMFCMVAIADRDTERYQSMLRESFDCESLIVNSNRW
ncbi:MAG: 4-(cytidine 5'-diphospho)-2-C-methyl-D-erythritol kinase [Planctomycetota bacterium]|nr:MAG: 4-(cytidine 5'-diphospho)-2-C-methyl-D-erythritol kinase [Planctomycetota bacterium]